MANVSKKENLPLGNVFLSETKKNILPMRHVCCKLLFCYQAAISLLSVDNGGPTFSRLTVLFFYCSQ